MTSAKTVLVPLDGSVDATAAIPVARGFGELLNATVALLHVSDDALTPAALVERMRLSGEDVPGVIVEHRQGAVAAEIVKAAGERHAAMIVMCPQIRTDLRWRALGSVAAAVLRAAPCPVVLVPSARGRKRWELHRLLVPHDGTPTSAATIGPAADLALKAAAAIVKEAGERHAAMIVMCPQIRTDLRWRALGSVAAAVLRTAPCPVVLVPPARGRKRWALHRLLVPHDGTPTSAATIGLATDLALKAAAELVVLHVATPGAEMPTEPGTLVSPRYVDQPQHEWPAWAQEFLARLCAVGDVRSGTGMRLAVAQGEAGAAIVDFARQSDLIVLGWRGALEPGRARTMQRVICETGCPMIVLRVDRDRDRRYWPWSS